MASRPRAFPPAAGVLALVAAFLPAPATAQISFPELGFERCAVPDTLSSPVVFTARITGNYDSVRLEAASGAQIPLVDQGGGVWAASVPAADLLFGYSPAFAGRNFVGYLRVRLGTTLLASLNILTGVVDSGVPAVTSQSGGPDVRYSCHVANLLKADLTYPPSGAQIVEITQAFYQAFADDFDFLNIVFSLPSWQSNRFHFVVSNDIQGLGLSLYSNAGVYGSAGRLKGISEYPIDTFYDLAETGSLHELGHQWINYCTFSTLQPGPHWRPGTQARGVMGTSAAGGQGLTFPYDLLDIGGGNWQMVAAPRLRDFTDLDLYLMGLLGAADVDSNFVFSSPTQPICNGCSGPVTWFTVDDLIAAQGARVPDVSTSPKEFRVATVVVTRDRFLDDTEMAHFDHLTLRGEATVPLPFRSGLEVGTTRPFFLATDSLGTLRTDLCVSATAAPELAVPPAGGEPGLRLAPNVPNPFEGETRVRLDLPAPGPVRARVVDVTGRLVRVLADGPRPAGPSWVVWDGRDGDGAIVPSGVYFLRVESEDAARSRRMVRIRR